MMKLQYLPRPNSMTGLGLLGACLQAAMSWPNHGAGTRTTAEVADLTLEIYEALDLKLRELIAEGPP